MIDKPPTSSIIMAALKTTSDVIIVSGTISESAANTATFATHDLQLNPLDNEAFIVYGVQSDIFPPDYVSATNSAVNFSMSTTQRTTVGDLANTNVFHSHILNIRTDAVGGVSFTQTGPDSPQAMGLQYLAIIATSDFHVGIQGTNNLTSKNADFKIYGARVRLTSSQYAALVQSELLSA